MKNINQRLYEIGIIPVIKIEDAEKAVPLARALAEGGLPAAEITFRVEGAADAIRAMRAAEPDMMLAAGTVLTTAQVDAATEAGVDFVVTPGLDPNIVRYCQEKGVPVIPGCATPSDLATANSLGLTAVKFFPAEAAGGMAMIKAMSAPYPMMKFMPTGGINENNLGEYLASDKVIACGGSFMVKDADLANGDFDAIRERTKASVLKMLNFRLFHVGINNPDADTAARGIEVLTDMFGESTRESRSAFFYGSWFEVMKKIGRGQQGHIGIATPNIDRAVAYLKRKGYEFIEESRGYDADGHLTVIYFKDEVMGFALHFSRA